MLRRYRLHLSVLTLSAWVFLANVTYVSDTAGWIMGLTAFVLTAWLMAEENGA